MENKIIYTGKGRATPVKVAREWAKENPDFSGLLLFRTLRGRGSRLGQKVVTVDVFVKECLANGRRKTTEGDVNGVCARCGDIYLLPKIRLSRFRDPDAGEPFTRTTPGADFLPSWEWGSLEAGGFDLIIAGESMMWACDACRVDPNLEYIGDGRPKNLGINRVWQAEDPTNTKTLEVVRVHPLSVRYEKDLPRLVVDMTDPKNITVGPDGSGPITYHFRKDA